MTSPVTSVVKTEVTGEVIPGYLKCRKLLKTGSHSHAQACQMLSEK